MDFIHYLILVNTDNDKAEDINFDCRFRKLGNATVNAVCDDKIAPLPSSEWNAFAKEQQEKIFAIQIDLFAETEVNWCPD
jgi:leucyl-tRNA synthetase